MMLPIQGQRVKCFMRSSVVLEGIVEEWTEACVVLKSIEDNSFIIVHRPAEDILITRAWNETSTPKKELPEIKKEISEKLRETISQPIESELNKKNIVQLRQLVIEQDKQIIAQKKKQHFGSVGAAKMAVPYSDQISIIGPKGK